jgi:hypothetical protein
MNFERKYNKLWQVHHAVMEKNVDLKEERDDLTTFQIVLVLVVKAKDVENS